MTALLLTLAVAAPPAVGRGERFEAAVENPAKYADPYRDVTLDVTYTRPDGSAVVFWGFHDGGTTWKLRFTPDKPGEWKYAARFSDGRPGMSGAFRCVASADPGPVTADPVNPQRFARGGRPSAVRSLHVGDRFFARNWPAAERAAFLDWAQGQGYNTLSVASFFLNRDSEGRGKGWQTPALWPPNAAEYQKAEAILDDVTSRGFVVFPFAGVFGRSSAMPRDPADQTAFIRYALARFGPYGNLLWNVGGPEPLLRNNTYLSADDVNRLGRDIRRLDPLGRPLTVHNPTGDDKFKDTDWPTFGTLQGPKTADLAKLYAGLRKNHHPARPLFAQETLWSGNEPHMRRVGRDFTDAELRRNALVILFAAADFCFADNAGDSSTGFSGTLKLSDRRQKRHDAVKTAWDVFESLPYRRTKPAPELVDHGFCLADPGRDYLVYLPDGGPVSVKTEGASFTVRWVNAVEPGDRRPGTAGKTYTPPAGGEWVLHLRAEPPARADAERGWHFPPPGEGFDKQDRRRPEDVSFAPAVIDSLKGKATRWALWRHGRLVHAEGDFNKPVHVASLRKTWHALAVGAALHQGRIPSLDQKIGEWVPGLTGHHADATWWHVVTQSSGFDYPYADQPAYRPGQMWTYSDKNPLRLTDALARVYGKAGYKDDYPAVLRAAYFDAIGMRGWTATPRYDGTVLSLDLEDMGRLGLLVLARGRWAGQQLVGQRFVEALETKQTYGMKANYNGPDDGKIPMNFREAPYGYMTWVNTAGDLYPTADRGWAWGTGSGGHGVFWNHRLGVAFAAHGRDRSVPFPEVIEAHPTGPGQLVTRGGTP